jgi:hypothetical protein
MEIPTVRAAQPQVKCDPFAASSHQVPGIRHERTSFCHFVRRDHMEERDVHSKD